MLEIDIPGTGNMRLTDLVLDYNGTIACKGMLISGVKERLQTLCQKLTVHIVTADTFGTAQNIIRSSFAKELAAGRICIEVLPAPEERSCDEAQAKLAILEAIGPASCCAMGNGRNDVLMLKAAALSFCILDGEGCAPQAFASAKIAVRDILSALELLLDTRCCIATLRI